MKLKEVKKNKNKRKQNKKQAKRTENGRSISFFPPFFVKTLRLIHSFGQQMAWDVLLLPARISRVHFSGCGEMWDTLLSEDMAFFMRQKV